MAGLSNLFLDQFLSPLCKNFIGTFAVDTLPSNLWSTSCCAIVNLSVSTHPGSHFIAFFIKKQNYLYYFDSYALPVPAYNHHLINFLKKMGKLQQDKTCPRPLDSSFRFFVLRVVCRRVLHVCQCIRKRGTTPLLYFFYPSDLRENDKCFKHLVKRLQVVLY